MDKDGESRWNLDDTVYRLIMGKVHAETCAKTPIKPERKQRYKPNESAEAAKICLTCTEPECTGSEICYERRKQFIQKHKTKGETK